MPEINKIRVGDTTYDLRDPSKLPTYISNDSGNECEVSLGLNGLAVGSSYRQECSFYGTNSIHLYADSDENQIYISPNNLIKYQDYGRDSLTYYWPLSGGTILTDGSGVRNTQTGPIKPWRHTTGTSTYNGGSTAPTAATNNPNISAISSTSDRYYAIETDSQNRAFVNVPWINTDTKVSYTYTTTNSNYPLLFKNSTGATITAAGTRFNTSITANPSTGTITATAFSGSGASLTSLNADNISSGTLAKERLPKQPLQVIRCYNGNTNNYKYHRFACVGTKSNPITSSFSDHDTLLFIRQSFNDGAHGILKLSLRTNGSGQPSNCSAKWILRNGFSQEAVKIGLVDTSGATFADIFIEMPSLWGRIDITPIEGPDSFTLMETCERDNTTASDKLDSYNVFSSMESACVELHGTGSSYTHFVASYDASVSLGDVTAYSVTGNFTGNFTGNGSNLTNISYNNTNFVYPYPGSFDANSPQACVEGHYFLIYGANTPTSHGFLDTSLFDGTAFDPCGLGRPMGVVKQRWLDWQTGYEWTRTYSDGTGWSIWNKIVTADANGNVSATSFSATSDKRLKENITSYACDKNILDIDVKKYDFINGAKNQIGCIAQELQEICPELVKEDENGYLSIYESKLVYPLLLKVKEQEKRLKALEAILKYKKGED